MSSIEDVRALRQYQYICTTLAQRINQKVGVNPVLISNFKSDIFGDRVTVSETFGYFSRSNLDVWHRHSTARGT